MPCARRRDTTNPQPPNPEDLLQDLIEGNLRSRPSDPDAIELAGIAGRLGQLGVAPPDPLARHRMIMRVNDAFEGHSRTDAWTWLLGWLGLGHRPRAVVQRFAAGALLVGAAGSGAGTVAGVSPAQMISDVGQFAHAAFLSLNPADSGSPPGDDDSDRQPVETATADAVTPQRPASTTPTQTGTPTPGDGSPADDTGTTAPGTTGAPSGSDDDPTTPGPTASAMTQTATPGSGGSPSPTATPTPPPSPTPDDKTPTPPPTPPSSTATPTPTPSPTPPKTPSPTPTASASQGVVYAADPAGAVRVARNGDDLQVTEVLANSGWTYTVDDPVTTPDIHRVKVTFFGPGSAEVEFEAEVVNGQVEPTVTTS